MVSVLPDVRAQSSMRILLDKGTYNEFMPVMGTLLKEDSCWVGSLVAHRPIQAVVQRGWVA